MFSSNFGDMARHALLQPQAAKMKSRISSLTKEMTTGQMDDKAAGLKGRLGILASVEHSRAMAEARQSSAQTVLSLLEIQQSVVTEISTKTDKALEAIMASEQSSNTLTLDRTLADIHAYFEDIVRLLNSRFAGRSVFAGSAVDQPAVISAAQMLDELATEMTIPIDVVTLSDQVDAWFAPGGSFDVAAYLGSAAISEPVALGHGISVRNDVTAQENAFRQTLAAFAKSALFASHVTEASHQDKQMIIAASGQALLQTQSALIDLGARLGGQEARAAYGKTRAEAEYMSLSIARADLLAVDPYAAASKLEQTMTQLDTVYALTARLSRLSLANHLR